MMNIRILITGGTFDKEYNELTGELFFKKTHLPEMLTLARSRVTVEMETLMRVDSLNMTDDDIHMIGERCQSAEEDKILITHGTDKIVNTAQYLGPRMKNKTIVLTGAMVPYAFGSSDGLFNLGSSLAFVQTLPCGVYVSMNGRYFTWDNVRKNKVLGIFEEITV